MSIKEVLHAAADLIEKKGWWASSQSPHWDLTSADGQCAQFAIEEVAGGTRNDATRALAEYLHLVPALDSADTLRSAAALRSAVYNWNDAHTPDAVIAGLRGAAGAQS